MCCEGKKGKVLDCTLLGVRMIGHRILLGKQPLNVGVPWYSMKLVKVSAGEVEVGE